MFHNGFRMYNAKNTPASEVENIIRIIEHKISQEQQQITIIENINTSINSSNPHSTTTINLKNLLSSNKTVETKINGILAVLKIAKRNDQMRGRHIITDICNEVRKTNTQQNKPTAAAIRLN